MKLESILTKFPMFKLINSAHKNQLNSFLQTIPMKLNQFKMFYQFDDYQNFLKNQGTKTYPFMWMEEEEILGYFTLSLRQHYWQDRPVCAAYLGDLRLNTSRLKELKKDWKQIIPEFISDLSESEEFQKIDYYYFSLMLDNERALNAFTQGRLGKFMGPLLPYTSYLISPQKNLAKSNLEFRLESKTSEGYNFLQESLKNKFWASSPSNYSEVQYLVGREKGSIVCVVEVFYLSKLRSLHVEMNNGQHFQLPSLYLGECVFNQFFQEDKKANFIEQMVSFLNNLYPQIPIMMNLPKKLSAQFYLKAEKTEAMLFQLKLRSTAHSPFQYLKQEDGPISAAWL